MSELCLEGLENTYENVSNEGRYEVYYDKYNNNLLVFNPIDVVDDTDAIISSTVLDAYEFLVNELNENNNLVVHWSKVEGTTSDFNIYYDLGDPKRLKKRKFSEILELMSNYSDLYNSCKFNKAVEGQLTPISIR